MKVTETYKASNVCEWRTWLGENGNIKSEIWLIYDDRDDHDTVSYLDSVEEAICFGWIDGIQKRIGEHEKAQRFTPRKAKSNWTQLNMARARRLIELGRMNQSGLRTLPNVYGAFKVPSYILNALDEEPNAKINFNKLPPLYVRVRVGYIDEMRKKPEELKKRLNNFVKKTAENKLFGNWNDGGRLKNDT